MARFSGNPTKNPLVGNELIPATDPSTSNDIAMTPLVITQFAQANMTIATGSTQGLISGSQADKLAGLPSNAQLSAEIAQLAEVAIPVFIAAPSNGSINIYQHVLDVPWILSFAYTQMSAGSANVSITKNNVNIAGFTNMGITSSAKTFTGTDTQANMTFNQGDLLGLTLSGTTGNAANMLLSIRANATIVL
jgi:hypothetical protein